jgi:hypothetical protein
VTVSLLPCQDHSLALLGSRQSFSPPMMKKAAGLKHGTLWGMLIMDHRRKTEHGIVLQCQRGEL